MIRAAVPETPVNEDGYLRPGKNYVGLRPELGKDFPIDEEAHALSVEDSPDCQLGGRVPSALALHTPQHRGRGSCWVGRGSDPLERRVVLVGHTDDHAPIVKGIARCRCRCLVDDRYIAAIIWEVDDGDSDTVEADFGGG